MRMLLWTDSGGQAKARRFLMLSLLRACGMGLIECKNAARLRLQIECLPFVGLLCATSWQQGLLFLWTHLCHVKLVFFLFYLLQI